MKKNPSLSVREINKGDIDHLLDYWYNSSPDYIKNMGANKDKLPTRSSFHQALNEQIKTPFIYKKSYCLIWEINNEQIGHTNANKIVFGKEATMHLHLWNSNTRKKGLGTELIKKSIPLYFKNLELQKLICEPYSLNIAPNKTLEKIGFSFIKKYTTIPGSINFEQEVNRWELTNESHLAFK